MYQDAALAPIDGRKVVLATNLAETSLTIEGVTDVIDTGLHRVPRRDPATGIDRLETERISRDAATQRAGRAGRTGPGRCLRLWDPRDEMRERREPEIERIDLAGPLLDVLAWGGDPRTFPWFEPPPTWAMEESLAFLERLGATRNGAIPPLGRSLRRLPLHPRLGRVLLAAKDRDEAAAALAAFAEGWVPPGGPVAGDCDRSPRPDVRGRPSSTRICRRCRARPRSWEYNEDATALTFTLRDGLKYSDGTPLNAKRFEYAILRNINPETAGEYAAITDDILGATEWRYGTTFAGDPACAAEECTDEEKAAFAEAMLQNVAALDSAGNPCTDYEQAECTTLKITLAHPAPYFHTVMSLWVTYPAKEESISEGGENWWNSSKFHIGNGPFVLRSLEPFVRGYFVPNENYWRGKATYDLEYSYITDSAVGFEAYKNNEFDIIGLAAEDLATVQADPVLNAEANIYPGSCTFAVMFLQLKEPLTDPKVREAFAYGLDRDGWVTDVLKGLGSTTLTWFLRGGRSKNQGITGNTLLWVLVSMLFLAFMSAVISRNIPSSENELADISTQVANLPAKQGTQVSSLPISLATPIAGMVEGTSTPVVDVPFSTPTLAIELPPATPTPLLAGPTAQPTPTLETVVLVIPTMGDQKYYTEDFNNDIPDWLRFMTFGDSRMVKETVGLGNLSVSLLPIEDKYAWYYLINNKFSYSNVKIEAVVTNQGNNANGVSLICGYSDIGWYEFVVSNSGIYSILAVDNQGIVNQGYNEIANGGSLKIKTGRQTNVYTAVCNGNELSLFINQTGSMEAGRK